jgi:hypothetical protein
MILVWVGVKALCQRGPHPSQKITTALSLRALYERTCECFLLMTQAIREMSEEEEERGG